MHTATHPSYETFARYWLDSEAAIRAYVRVSIRNADDAADVVQDAALRIARNFEAYDSDRPFHPWAMRIARSAIIDFLRKQSRQKEACLDPAAIDALATSFGRAASDITQMQRSIDACLEKLPPRWVGIVRMRFGQDVAPRHIAMQLGITPEAVRSALVRIRQRMTECLDAQLRGRLRPEGAAE